MPLLPIWNEKFLIHLYIHEPNILLILEKDEVREKKLLYSGEQIKQPLDDNFFFLKSPKKIQCFYLPLLFTSGLFSCYLNFS